MVMFDKKGNGSVTVKIKSGCLTYEEEEIDRLMKAAVTALRAGYLKLRDLKEQHSREREGSVGTMNLFDQKDSYVTLQEQADLADADEHNADPDNIFKKVVEVEPGSLVDKLKKAKGQRAKEV